ncbi:MAG: hypothetical protein LBN36_02890 [Clostridiales Family XIII bacterium]|jgi:hypothetical protein|nr:hypothetical protein [Clostridiales Family XIII bacterium]
MYSKSDIIVAIVIILIAALIIWFRVDAIMVYPSSDTSGTIIAQDPGADDGSGSAAGIPVVTGGGIGTPSGDAPVDTVTPEPITEPPAPPVDTTPPPTPPPTETTQFVVNSGEATSTIASNLAAAGLVSSSTDFLNAVKAVGAETRLKAGTFQIPAGSNIDQIIQILTR